MLTCPTAGTTLSIRPINGRLKLLSKAFRGDSCSSLLQAKGDLRQSGHLNWDRNLTFQVLHYCSEVLKQNPGLTCPYKQEWTGIWVQMSLSPFRRTRDCVLISGGRKWDWCCRNPIRNLNLGFLLALLFSLSVYTKDRPRPTVSVQPNHDTHWAVNTHTNTKRKRKSGSLSISLGMFICPS